MLSCSDYFGSTTILASGATLIVLYLGIAYTRRILVSGVKLVYSATSASLISETNLLNKPLTLVDLVKTEVPALHGPEPIFRSVWWLPGGNAQTIYCSLGAFNQVDPIVYERKLLRLPDGGTLALDITPPFSVHPRTIGEPVLLVTHGLTGGSHESYVRAALTALASLELPSDRRFRAVVLNSRGCNGSPVTSPKLYHAGTTDDIRDAVLWICHTFPGSSIFGLGFSLGANTLTKYVGEEGPDCPMSGIVSLANVWDFARGSPHIEYGSWMNRFIYDFVLGGALQALLRQHRRIFYEDPASPLSATLLDGFLKRKNVRLRDYDSVITPRIYGFKDSTDYYSAISSCRVVHRISIPCLAINAADDPIVTVDNIPVCQILQSSWVIQAITGGGGHMGWFESPNRSGQNYQRWYVKPTVQYLLALLKLGLAVRPKPRITEDSNRGVYVQENRPDIGFREVEEDSIVTSGAGDSKLFSGW
ncbi:AB-hydrolase YheT [Neolentinus lepideus HHB14362 ss-1]|uniref:AB-hydrolase YheT n=1 Tax=Neolentinus lepideus HHB14362 ss-1 TaxID=1314782 RepID=A0A165QV86_9AGAM|nr:AB-hydrolase YheT [Neolentinus lepideus HHB14362 ss-1]